MDTLSWPHAECRHSPTGEHEAAKNDLGVCCKWCRVIPSEHRCTHMKDGWDTVVTNDYGDDHCTQCYALIAKAPRRVRVVPTVVQVERAVKTATPPAPKPFRTRAERHETALAQRIAKPVNSPKGNGRIAKIRALIERDGLQCFYCEHELLDHDLTCFDQAQWWPTLDHLLPKMAGGTNDLENLVLACKTCNQRKSGHILVLIELVKRLREERLDMADQLVRDRAYTEHLKWELFDAGLGEMPGIVTIDKKQRAVLVRPRPGMHNDALFIELGLRVVANLRAENAQKPHARTASIIKRARKLMDRHAVL